MKNGCWFLFTINIGHYVSQIYALLAWSRKGYVIKFDRRQRYDRLSTVRRICQPFRWRWRIIPVLCAIIHALARQWDWSCSWWVSVSCPAAQWRQGTSWGVTLVSYGYDFETLWSHMFRNRVCFKVLTSSWSSKTKRRSQMCGATNSCCGDLVEPERPSTMKSSGQRNQHYNAYFTQGV